MREVIKNIMFNLMVGLMMIGIAFFIIIWLGSLLFLQNSFIARIIFVIGLLIVAYFIGEYIRKE